MIGQFGTNVKEKTKKDIEAKIRDMQGRKIADTAAQKAQEEEIDPMSIVKVMINGAEMVAGKMSASQAIEWLDSRGKAFRLSDNASQLWVEPKLDDLETWVVKTNAKVMKAILARRREQAANQTWEDAGVAALVKGATEAAKAASGVLEKAVKGDGTAEAWDVVIINLSSLAEGIINREREKVWEAADNIVWLCGQLKEWGRDPKKKPPKELYTD
jgi:hypothetical protein